MNITKNLAIIGAGASGLCAAIEAKRNNDNIDVTVFDRMQKAGKKILATGNGRCNFTNKDLSLTHFYGDRLFIKSILDSPLSDAEEFFKANGILTYEEDGRIYPRSQQASTIRESLLTAAYNLGVTVTTETHIDSVAKKDNQFIINNKAFDAVIICGGGKASFAHGSDGSCYKLLESLGHTLTPLYPALCGLVFADKDIASLKGVRAECKAKLYSESRFLGAEEGEVQFTDKAVSGIPVMNLSHLCKSNGKLRLDIDLCPEISKDALFGHLQRVVSESPYCELETALNGIVNIKIAYVVMKRCGIKGQTLCRKLSLSQIARLADELKLFTVNIKSTKGFDSAQITCGGIKTQDFDPSTMMSLITDGLFACGEILDVHGDCGGYNLHLAWATGRIAGKSAANYLG